MVWLTRLTSAELPRELVVVSWNVLGDASKRDQRLPALMATLGEAKANVIAVQEATTWFSTALLSQPWATGMQRVETDPDRPFPGGLAVFTNLPVSRHAVVDLPTTMGRCGLSVEIIVAQTPICFGVVHLDSLLKDGPTRRAQMQVMAEVLRPHAHSILLGDFNFADGDAEERNVLPGTIDAWRLLHQDQPGFT